MDLVRNCLDKQLVDRNGRAMGRVDGVVIRFEDGRQPTVAYVEVGAVVYAERLWRGLERVVRKISRTWKVDPQDPFRIPWSKLVSAGVEVIAAVEAEKTPALSWELWLRRKIVSRLPGGGK